MSILLSTSLLYTFSMQHSNQKFRYNNHIAHFFDCIDWFVLRKRNLDFWVLGKIHWPFNRVIFYHMVHEKVYQRVLISITSKKRKTIHEGAKIKWRNRHLTCFYWKKTLWLKLILIFFNFRKKELIKFWILSWIKF